MKKIAGLALGGILLLSCFSTFAQTYAESALLYTRTNPGGSARIQALGGAQVSLGGDYSSAYSNPAGLGMYNKSEVTFTPGFSSSNTSSSYLGTTTKDNASKLIIPGFSAVFHKDKNNGILLSGSLGISFNRTNNFNNTFSYGATNPDPNNRIVDYFVNDANTANGYPSDLFAYPYGTLVNTPTELAWDNYLVNPYSNTDSLHYATDVNGVAKQHETVSTSGSQSQLNVSYGLNLGDRFYFGFGIGIASVNYKSRKTFTEFYSVDPLRSLSLTEALNSSSTGINATLGTIIKPVDFVQLGVSVMTPTYYGFNDTYQASLTTDWSNFPYAAQAPGPVSTDPVLANYSFTTPWRLNAGATVFVQKFGFLTADVEYLNYSSSKYHSKSDGVNLTPDNDDIRAAYTSALNFRGGAEFRLNSFRLRGGYSLMPDPYKSLQNNVDNKIQKFSVGAGYRTSKFFVDIAGVFSQGNTTYTPYTQAPIVQTQNNNTTVMVTVGFPLAH